MARICTVEGCSKPLKARGFCAAHWSRWRNHGDPLGKAPPPENGRFKWLVEHASYPGDDCLTWPFAILPDGRGYCRFRGTSMKAARAMCIVAHGEPPADMEAAHSCGNGHLGCVNPRHLRWRTMRENQAERIQHGTSNRGERHGFATLREDDVRLIRELRGSLSTRKIAKRFGIAHAQVLKIHHGRAWAWLV